MFRPLPILAVVLVAVPAAVLAAPAPPPATVIAIESFQFTPENVVIPKGSRVTFVNKDAAPHSATPEEGAKFTGTGRLLAGESKTLTFPDNGVYDYFCEFHTTMKGRVTVR
ncbi:cupredoxin domain-containing protein [Gloeobacter morelensis]|uniref:Cupredoxin family copper-binding protein n=1 Tax=Gloeobacter morelensis MG652769 TaxID=2781736 RepID=A0ABY3PQ52_9CYAN|nr:cupredoxin family copper-binding protein [Gloeobacter morelensis]UFP95840.1 cupredoxin family copper-binding protein [Gloeobacter morelensis MG652769]